MQAFELDNYYQEAFFVLILFNTVLPGKGNTTAVTTEHVAVNLYLLIFLLVVALFFGLLLFFATLVLKHRDFSKYDSTILGAPGLSVNPMVSLTARIIRLSNEGNHKYIDRIKSLLKDHEDVNCTRSKGCGFRAKDLGPCALEPYGYEGPNRQICVYFLVNKIFHWVPQCLNNSWHLPIQMPIDVKGNIQNLYALNPDTSLNYIWIACVGHAAVDKDNIDRIMYFPHPGFDSKYFPYKKNSASSPIVAVKFYGLKRKTLITVRCHLYAKNIPENYFSLFQIYIE